MIVTFIFVLNSCFNKLHKYELPLPVSNVRGNLMVELQTGAKKCLSDD